MTSSDSQSSDSCPTSRESDLDDGVLPQHKCYKYHSSYQSSCESDERFRNFVRKSKKEIDYAFCTFCAKDIKISGGGVNDLSRHSETALHLRSTKAVTTTPNIAAFMASSNTLATKVIKS